MKNQQEKNLLVKNSATRRQNCGMSLKLGVPSGKQHGDSTGLCHPATEPTASPVGPYKHNPGHEESHCVLVSETGQISHHCLLLCCV